MSVSNTTKRVMELEMVGSDKTIKTDVRIIAASNQNLRELVDDGKFRANSNA